jgi:hypothetical protein
MMDKYGLPVVPRMYIDIGFEKKSLKIDTLVLDTQYIHNIMLTTNPPTIDYNGVQSIVRILVRQRSNFIPITY